MDALFDQGLRLIGEARDLAKDSVVDVVKLNRGLSLYFEGIEKFLLVKDAAGDAKTQEQAHLTCDQLLGEAEIVKARIASLGAGAASAGAGAASAGAGAGGGKEHGRGAKNWCKVNLSKPAAVPSTDISRLVASALGSGGAAGATGKGGSKGGSAGGARVASPAAAAAGAGVGTKEVALNEFEKKIADDMCEGVPDVNWGDIKGLDLAMKTVQETVILPSLRPDVFRGLLAPTKGILFYGPPGTGKTLLAKAVAKESGYCFFNISAASLTSKWVGEGEKLLKGLFSIAAKKQPSLLFFDEIDAILSARSENEADHSRRLKTEFMIQTDGAATSAEDRILILGATNRPWDLDDAVMRRMPKKIYIALPSPEARADMIRYHMEKVEVKLSDATVARVVKACAGYSGSDLKALCKEAAMGPIRRVSPEKLLTVAADSLKAVTEADFMSATKIIRPSSGQDSLQHYAKWTAEFGAG